MARILPESRHFSLAGWLDFVLPGTCLLCGCQNRSVLCGHCAGDLPRLASACPRCALPTPHGELCGSCLARPPHHDHTFGVFVYAFPVDRLIHRCKYGGELALASWFGMALAESLRDQDIDLVVPMPLHPQRLKERGFNQAAEVARIIGRACGLGIDVDCLTRPRQTAHQADLPHRERVANIRNAFECSRDLSGQRVLLVDDVMTTGATVNECARVLKLHAAASVSVAVVARALLD